MSKKNKDQVVTEPKRNAITLFNIAQVTFIIILTNNTFIITLFQISIMANKTKDVTRILLEPVPTRIRAKK